jgi:tetraacyldisaccharide 4'-kinase
MERLRRTIESILHDERPLRPRLLGGLLLGLSLGYGAVVRLRAAAYRYALLPSRQLPCRTVSIGNITVGGTGKTPLAIYTAELAQAMGYRTAVVSRGYRGRAEKRGGIVSDGRRLLMDGPTAGDEPYMMARRLLDDGIPVVVGGDRRAAGQLAVATFAPDVIVLDDAFQHLALRRDVNLVILDGRRPLGNHYLLPRGILREPASALARSDALVFTRTTGDRVPDRRELPSPLREIARGRPLFALQRRPYLYRVVGGNTSEPTADDLRRSPALSPGTRVYGFSGIARNADFRHTLEKFDLVVAGFREFPDHHAYSDVQIRSLAAAADRVQADFLATTEKDYARIADRGPVPVALAIFGLGVDFGQQSDQFRQWLSDRLAQKAPVSRQ